jgi:hypothetical protein
MKRGSRKKSRLLRDRSIGIDRPRQIGGDFLSVDLVFRPLGIKEMQRVSVLKLDIAR